MVRGYLSLIKLGWKTGFVYRFHYFASVLITPLTLVIYYSLWKSIFSYSGQELIKGFSFNGMISYYAISMIVGVWTWCDVDEWFEHDVRKGILVADLLRPINYLAEIYFSNFGLRILAVFIEILPICLIALIFFKLQLPSLTSLLFFIVTLFFASLLYFFFTYLVAMTAFWLNKTSGIRRVKRIFIAFLSGSMIPLTFFPNSLQNIFTFLPFQYMRFVPINIYLGKYSVMQILILLSIQLIWVFLLFLFSKLVWHLGIKKFTGAGA